MDINAYIDALVKIRANVIPRAVRKALTDTAFRVRRDSIKKINSRLIIRNKYSERSIRVKPAIGSRIDTMESQTGSLLEYMRLQEEGTVVSAKRSRLAIPTSRSRISQSKTKPVASRYRLNNIGQVKGKGSKVFAANLRRKGFYIRKSKQLIMIRNLEKKSVTIKPVRWLSDATEHEATRDKMSRRFIFEANAAMGIANS